MRLTRRLLAPTLTAALAAGGALGIAVAPAAHADTTSPLPNLAGFHQMVVDSTDGYVFLSEGSIGSTSGIVVTSLAGSYVTTLDAGDDVVGIALGNGSLYAALASQDTIGVIDAATLAQTQTYALPTGDIPSALALQSGKLWVAYSGQGSSGIGDIDLTTGTFDSGITGLAGLTDLASDPSDSGVLVAYSTTLGFATYDTSVIPATPIAGPGPLGVDCQNERQLAVVPGGNEFLVACGFPYSISTIATNNLSTVASNYPTGAYPAAVAVANDGTVAAATYTSVQVYGPDGTERNALPVVSLAPAGLAWSADGAQLYTITGWPAGPYSLHVFDSPRLATASLALGGPSATYAGTPVTLTGKLSLAVGATATGTPVTLTRTNPDGTTTPIPGIATNDASGDFTVTDSTTLTAGTYTYTASVPATATTTSATATAQVTVAVNTATLTLSGSSTTYAGSAVTLTGKLSLAVGTPAAGTPVAVTRANPDGTATSIPGVATSDAGGDFTVTDSTVLPTGSYAYTASVPATAATTSATATAQVTVTLHTATVSLSGPSSVLPLKSFAVSGKLSLAGGTPAGGTPITVSRKNPNGSTSTISGITTGSNGAFTISGQDFSTRGAYTYTASVPVTPTTSAASSTYKVTVAKGTPTLTLSTGASTTLYDSTIHVTAHLGTTYTNRTVSVYAQLAGSSTKKLLKTAKVNSSGNLTISYPGATRTVTFTVTFTGDAQYNARSVSARVGVDVRVAMTNGGWYTSSAYEGVTYRVYHHTGVVSASISVTPNKHGECVQLAVQQLGNSGWFTNITFSCDSLSSSSKFLEYLTLAQAAGARYRLRAVFHPSSKDVTNVSYYSSWFYFQVVK